MAVLSPFFESKDAALSALHEVAVITALSLLPLMGIAYYQFVIQDMGFPPPAQNPNHAPFSAFAYQNIAAGQLAFYAISNWASVAWLCGANDRSHLILRPLFIVFCI